MTDSQKYPNINQRRVETNGISLNIAEQGEGPLVLMLHGFPESWYSWRHQFSALAEAGYHAVAPDMRGYGESDKPFEIEAYNQLEVVNDIIGLIPALGYETAVVFGHDWGAPTAWSCALNHPDKVSAVGALSVQLDSCRVPCRPRNRSRGDSTRRTRTRTFGRDTTPGAQGTSTPHTHETRGQRASTIRAAERQRHHSHCARHGCGYGSKARTAHTGMPCCIFQSRSSPGDAP